MSGWLPYEEVHGPENTVSGTVLSWPELESPQLGGSRETLVYLPPSLAAGTGAAGRRYPTLYFHDGQNVFDALTSYAGEWHADETLEALAAEEGLEVIAVAVANSGEGRMDDYNPWRSSERYWRGGRVVGGKGDAYLAFLAQTVKPLIDRSFPTSGLREETGIIGSSMAGLISLYGLLTRGEVFGLVGALSPSLAWANFRLLSLIEERGLPPARIYVDVGGREGRGMVPNARRLRNLLLAKGCAEGRDLLYVEARHAGHNEHAWARRLPAAIRFLLAATSGG